jgi:hypothetical protein
VVLIGPWGLLKDAAGAVGSPAWLAYAAVFLAINLVILPGLFWLAVRAGAWLEARARRDNPLAPAAPPTRRLFADYAAALVPLGLAAWIAFSLSFVLINLSYAWPVISDPMGWGWNLLGTASLGWTPYVSGAIPLLQIPVLLVGLAVSIALAFRIARTGARSSWSALPPALFCAAAAVALLAVYLA